jgi:hypothetical protein
MSEPSGGGTPPDRPPSDEELRAAYERIKREFTVEHFLANYDPEEVGVPLEEVIKELEGLDAQSGASGPSE